MKNNSSGHILTLVSIALLYPFVLLGQAPSIISKPESVAVPEGGTAVLSVTMSGELPITYKWFRNFNFFTPYYQATLDSTNCTLTLTNLTPDDASVFFLDTQNAFGYGPGAQAIVAVISAGMETNGFALTIRGLTNSFWTIDCSTNLPGQWFTLTNFNFPANVPVFKFVDLEATNRNRFYQVHPKVF